jgi:MFS family permease
MISSSQVKKDFLHTHRFSFGHTRALPTLALNRMLAFAASSVIGIFLPIFLFEFFHRSIQAVLLFYLADQLLKLPFFVPGAKLFSKIGLKKSMAIGVVGLSIFYFTFFLLGQPVQIPPFVLIGIGIIGLTICSTLYWSPFHIDFAEFSTKEKRGRQVSALFMVQQVIGVAGPIVSGLLILYYGYTMTFIVGFVLVVSSLIPLLYLPKKMVQYEFGYWQSFRELFSKRFRSMSLSMMAFGAENMVGVIVWPIFLYTVFEGDYLNIGFFAALIVITTLLLQMFVGKEVDKISAKRMLRIGTGVYALGWVWKGLVQTITGVFAASTFHSLGSIFLQTPMDAMTYEQAADAGHYIDEYTVLREMSLNIGRILIILFLLVLSLRFSITISFFVAAFISLGINRLSNVIAQE